MKLIFIVQPLASYAPHIESLVEWMSFLHPINVRICDYHQFQLALHHDQI